MREKFVGVGPLGIAVGNEGLADHSTYGEGWRTDALHSPGVESLLAPREARGFLRASAARLLLVTSEYLLFLGGGMAKCDRLIYAGADDLVQDSAVSEGLAFERARYWSPVLREARDDPEWAGLLGPVGGLPSVGVDDDQGPVSGVEHEVDVVREADLLPDPFWAKMGEQGRGASLLFEAGLRRKAYRYADCGTRAEKMPCSSFPVEHKFYSHYHCMNRFCKYDGGLHVARLKTAYEPPLVKFLRDAPIPPGYTLARWNVTKRCHGEEPTPGEVQAFSEAVNRALGKAVRAVLVRWASSDDTRKVLVWRQARNRGGEDGASLDRLPVQMEVGEALSRRKMAHGAFFNAEYGYETRGHLPDVERVAHGKNLHAHGIFLVPFLPNWREGWTIFRDAWREESARAFGEVSHGFWLTHFRGWRRDPVKAVKHALNHCFKYVSKMPYETLERMVLFEKALDGVRRVHAVGLWFGLPRERAGSGSQYCPACAKQGRVSRLYLSRRLLPGGREIPEYWPVSVLESEGWRSLESARLDSSNRGRDP